MAIGELNGYGLRGDINNLAGAVTTGCCQAKVVIGEGQVHDGIVVSLDMTVDLGVRGTDAISCFEKADIALFIANGCDRGLVAAGEGEWYRVAGARVCSAGVDICLAAVVGGCLETGIECWPGEVLLASVSGEAMLTV